jgi:hypothetical protein
MNNSPSTVNYRGTWIKNLVVKQNTRSLSGALGRTTETYEILKWEAVHPLPNYAAAHLKRP